MTNNKLSFEEALARLEKIVDELERGEYTLEESLKKFEEGLELGKKCQKFLDEAEGKMRKLMEDEDGQITEEDVSGEY